MPHPRPSPDERGVESLDKKTNIFLDIKTGFFLDIKTK